MGALSAGRATTDAWVAPKVAGGILRSSRAVMFPYVLNVMNNGTPAQIRCIHSQLPAMFPAGNSILFYVHAFLITRWRAGCGRGRQSPCNVRDIGVTLSVQSPADAQNRMLRWSS